VEFPVTADYDLPKRTQERLNAAAALQGLMTVQGGTPWQTQIPRERGGAMFVPAEGKIPEDVMLRAAEAKPGNVAIADTGAGRAVFAFDGTDMPKADKDLLADILGDGEFKHTQHRGDYIGYEDQLKLAPGSGEATTKMFGYLDKLGKGDFAALDKAVRKPAAELLDIYGKTAKGKGMPVREDVMQMLDILRTGGLTGLKAALESKSFLPTAAALAFLPSLLDKERSADH
jgi:hypothetical protein